MTNQAMTVKQLIKELRKLPSDAFVSLTDGDNFGHDVVEVGSAHVFSGQNHVSFYTSDDDKLYGEEGKAHYSFKQMEEDNNANPKTP